MFLVAQAFLSILFAWLFDWSPGELIWSFWIASLVTGWTMLASQTVLVFSRVKPGAAPDSDYFNAAVSTFTMGGFLFVHFTGFHIAHAIFLNSLYPMIDQTVFASDDWTVLALALSKAFLKIAPSAIIAALWTAHARRQAAKTNPEASADWDTFPTTSLYFGVFRIHLLIFALIIMTSEHCSQFTIYQVVILAFLPYERWFVTRPKNQTNTPDSRRKAQLTRRVPANPTTRPHKA